MEQPLEQKAVDGAELLCEACQRARAVMLAHGSLTGFEMCTACREELARIRTAAAGQGFQIGI